MRIASLPRRYVVERSLSWFGRNWRLGKDFRESSRNSGRPRYPRLHQLARRRLARAWTANSINHGLHLSMMKGCKSDGERTFSGTCGNDGDAPMIGIGGRLAVPPLPHHRAY